MPALLNSRIDCRSTQPYREPVRLEVIRHRSRPGRGVRRVSARDEYRSAPRASRTSGTRSRRRPHRPRHPRAASRRPVRSSAATCGYAAARRSRIAATGSIAITRAPVASRFGRNLLSPAPKVDRRCRFIERERIGSQPTAAVGQSGRLRASPSAPCAKPAAADRCNDVDVMARSGGSGMQRVAAALLVPVPPISRAHGAANPSRVSASRPTPSRQPADNRDRSAARAHR